MNDIKSDYSIESIDTIKEYIIEGDSYTSGENSDYNKALISYEKAKADAYELLKRSDEEETKEIHELLGIVYRKIGDLYFNRRIGISVDYDTAIDCYRFAKHYGNVCATLTLAYIYLGMYNIPEYYDREEGISYLNELADQGCEEALLVLGSVWLSDKEPGQNIEEAEKCFKKCGFQYGIYRTRIERITNLEKATKKVG